MSKLLKWKEWLTLAEAAAHMSNVLSEPVIEADLLRLALDGHLKLSANLVNYAYGKRGKVVSLAEAGTMTIPWQETLEEDLSPPDDRGRRRRRPDAPFRGWTTIEVQKGSVISDSEAIIFEDLVRRMEGVWDLPMIGGERIDVERMLQDKIGGPEVELVNIDGGLLAQSHDESEIWAVMEPYNHKEINPAWLALPRHPEVPQFTDNIVHSHIPMAGLPEKCLLVLRTREIQRFLTHAAGVDAPSRPGRSWPDHETSKLVALRDAAQQWWSSYVEGETEPPASKEVAAWLVERHGVSEEMASAMAAILRPDGLKPGPKRRSAR